MPASVANLTILWTFDGREACLEVDEVSVILEDPFGFVYDDADYPCDFGGVSYEDVIAGDWLVTLRARDTRGVVLYRALDVPLVVEAYTDDEVTVDLR